MDPFIQKMIDERDAAIAEMKKKRGKAGYRDLTDATDKMTKNIQLLSGKETENSSVTVNVVDYSK
jgi:hypothetical protein